MLGQHPKQLPSDHQRVNDMEITILPVAFIIVYMYLTWWKEKKYELRCPIPLCQLLPAECVWQNKISWGMSLCHEWHTGKTNVFFSVNVVRLLMFTWFAINIRCLGTELHERWEMWNGFHPWLPFVMILNQLLESQKTKLFESRSWTIKIFFVHMYTKR